ncbi:MAG: hypothetical protein BGO10_08605 [Chlamydia sp. 32-24]|nr:MAG: hypothetical protein BGO10_08605 [Chlamydia sp. 32-24]
MSFHNLGSLLEQSSNCILFNVLPSIQVHETKKTTFSTSLKIETLITELKEKGPFIGMGKIGPAYYENEPFKLKDSYGSKHIYGWKPGSKRIDNKTLSFFLLGAKKTNDQGIVYFAMAQDITLSTLPLRQFVTSEKEPKIYVTSFKTFLENLVDLFPNSLVSTNTEQNFAKRIIVFPLDSILDEGEMEAKCKAIGQEAFDYFKEQANGDSLAGKEAVRNICESLPSLCEDGRLRSQYVERAWDGIGDSNWTWRA